MSAWDLILVVGRSSVVGGRWSVDRDDRYTGGGAHNYDREPQKKMMTIGSPPARWRALEQLERAAAGSGRL
jgi:hypothetical protein